MPKLTSSYTEFKIAPSQAYPSGQTFFRPFLNVKLTASNGRSCRIFGLLDTGADACIFPLRIAKFLRLDLPSLAKAMTGGIGEALHVTYYDTISVDLGNGMLGSVYAGFTEGMDKPAIGLLGQEGFFSRYDVAFSRSARTFTVQLP